MNHPSRFMQSIGLLLILAACAPVPTPEISTPTPFIGTPSFTPPPSQTPFIPTNPPLVSPTRYVSPTYTIVPTPEIDDLGEVTTLTDLTERNLPDIVAVLWEPYYHAFYYGIGSDAEPDPQKWFLRDAITGYTRKVSNVPQNYIPPGARTKFISPSKAYTILSVLVEEGNGPESSPLYNHWLEDNKSGESFPILSGARRLLNPQWSYEDTNLGFTLAGMDCADYYIFNLEELKTSYLGDLTQEHSGCARGNALLSPTGDYLATYSLDTPQLQIINLNSGKSEYTDGSPLSFNWAPDGSALYYYLEPSLRNEPETFAAGPGIFRYSLQSNQLSIFVKLPTLQANRICPPDFRCSFEVSTDQQFILIWNSETIWLVELPPS